MGANISLTLGAGSVSSPYYYDVRITKQLAYKTPSTPVFVPTFSLVSYSSVGNDQYQAIVNVQGIVTYQPCKKCCAKSQTINQNIVIPFYSTTVPSSVSVASGTPINGLSLTGCAICSNVFVCDIPLSLTIQTT